ncbi:MAG: DUF2891 domain-containing protein [Myxococcales bacterium]|nr:DUF2891 domain-containing protein [Myxococcales bacterium]
MRSAWRGLFFLLVVHTAGAAPPTELSAPPVAMSMAAAQSDRFADLALSCVDREYPNKIAHVLSSDADVASPRTLTPSFYGCFDWHSAVHGHWLLVRLLRQAANQGPTQPAWTKAAREILGRHLRAEPIAKEVAYLRGAGRASFERPYGLAWLLQLGAELTELAQSGDKDAQTWSQALRPLELAAVERLAAWLPKLTHPVRSGEHSQTAFALGLALDWARTQRPSSLAVRIPLQPPKVATANPSSDAIPPKLAALIDERARVFFAKDLACPLAYEPSGEDFLSPCLAEADLMRRVLATAEFSRWLSAFLPLSNLHALRPAEVSDRTDGKLVHLDGLNLSRAWMLFGIASALPDSLQGTQTTSIVPTWPSTLPFPATVTHPLKLELLRLAIAHRDAGLAALSSQSYEGGHWLGSFATYLVSGRGLRNYEHR